MLNKKQLKEILDSTYEAHLHIESVITKGKEVKKVVNENYLENVGSCEVCHKSFFDSISEKFEYKFGKIYVSEDHDSMYIQLDSSVLILDPTRFGGAFNFFHF
jgi:hypothetical protein